MADIHYNYTKYQANNNNNPAKFYSHFLYKAVIVSIFLVILPLFPSHAPEFINQTLNTRSWELLHLIFVGIAVSYGLFSRRNDETEKDNITANNSSTKFDNAQSYVSRILQVSSVFDDESHSPSRSDGSTVQTWNNQYYRNDPVVVVAEEHSDLDQQQSVLKKQRVTNSTIGEKPLFLPVRSLKSRIFYVDGNENNKDSFDSGVSARIGRSSSMGSKRVSSNSVKAAYQDFEETMKDDLVLPSPIPWRSRSGRIEMKEAKEKEEAYSPPLYALPPSMEESEFNRSFKAQMSRSPQPNSANSSPKLSPSPSMSSPKNFSPSPSFSTETQGKIAEDFVRKKCIYRSPPPPPPTPPRHQIIRKFRSMQRSPGSIDEVGFLEKEFKGSLTSKPKDKNRGGSMSNPTSVRTARSHDSIAVARKEKEVDQSKIKNERLSRDRVTFKPQPTFREFPKEDKQEFVEKLVLESEEDMETEYEDEDDDDETVANSLASGTATASSKNEEVAVIASSNASDGGPDVDKKADEFIAKFREQIRLQRIESIKRSSVQISRKATR